MSTGLPRRGQTLPANLHPDALLPHSAQAQNSPMSMKYSVSCSGGGGGTKTGVSGSERYVESHPSVTDLNQDSARQTDEKLLQWHMLLHLFQAVCSALFTVISLQFHFSQTDKFLRSAKSPTAPYRGILDVIRDVICSFDVAIVVLSIVSFFVTSLQLLFVLKIVKTPRNGRTDVDGALQYIRNTSFLRIVNFSFWFASIIIFAIIIMLSCAIDPSRSLASKCVSITLGSSALFMAVVFVARTLHFWAKHSYGHVYREDCYNYLSTLV